MFEESGTFSVRGDSLMISPKTSKATLKNREGVVRKAQNNPLESVAYKWKTHFFEGIGELNLVLEPSKPTTRDGAVSGSSLFPNAYLYGQGDKIEWKF